MSVAVSTVVFSSIMPVGSLWLRQYSVLNVPVLLISTSYAWLELL